MSYLPYAGIGSRQTPEDVQKTMTHIAQQLEMNGYVLRSGGAGGADEAFECGVSLPINKEIYIPWNGFNGRYVRETGVYICDNEVAERMAAAYHPAWGRCSQGARKLHTRNVGQILGEDLQSPSLFVICWTKDGLRQGGTGQALRIAEAQNIPIFDLGSMRPKEVIHKLNDLHERMVA